VTAVMLSARGHNSSGTERKKGDALCYRSNEQKDQGKRVEGTEEEGVGKTTSSSSSQRIKKK